MFSMFLHKRFLDVKVVTLITLTKYYTSLNAFVDETPSEFR